MPMTFKNITINVIVIFASWQIFNMAIASAIPKEFLEAEMEEEDMKPLFIPFPGTVKQLPPKPYAGNSPEWQEFIKLSKDVALQNQIRTDLAEFGRNIVSTHPGITVRFGNKFKVRRQWIDIDFPPQAPPEFERSGLEIDEGTISWVTQPVDSLTVSKNRQSLWPAAMTLSTWSFAKAVAEVELREIKTKLGISSPPPPPIFPQMIGKPGASPFSTAGGMPAKPSTALDAAKAMAGATSGASAVREPVPSKKSSDQPHTWFSEDTAPPFPEALHTRALIGMRAFRNTLAQNWKPAQAYPPKGSILVGGMVELESPMAFIVLDITTAWDPKTKNFEQRCMNLKVRRISPKTQRPLMR